ncbi:MAG: CehA/McbA family metallohydrolase [Syntrophales bacterium]|nr:CehA/McbA family metallohydrolase [Syntrophales bacterium]MDD5532119.1 CehA/McbA family metallohydrolase [Syntrophales bacterium]
MKLYDYSGIIHFHSEYSFDGRASIPEIIGAARESGIDFLILTDHDNLEAREKGEEGWHGNVLLLSGEEVCLGQFNHYLVFGHDRPLGPAFAGGSSPQALIDKVREQGGIGFIAHPDHEGTEMFHVKQYAWTEWGVGGYTGMSIWDFMTDWQSSLKGYASGFFGYFFPAYALRGPRQVTLKRWDELAKTRKIAGIGECDNHDTPKKLFGVTLRVFPFRRAFRFVVRTHVLLAEELTPGNKTGISNILDALRRGAGYVAMEYFASARGFSFTISSGPREATMGEDFLLDGPADLRVTTPAEGMIRIIKDGMVFLQKKGAELEHRVVEEGVYRVEVSLKRSGRNRPWIYSNPIYVKEGERLKTKC